MPQVPARLSPCRVRGRPPGGPCQAHDPLPRGTEGIKEGGDPVSVFTVYRIAMCGQLDALVYVLATTCVPQLPGRGVAWLATAVFSAAVLVTVLLGAVGGGSREV